MLIYFKFLVKLQIINILSGEQIIKLLNPKYIFWDFKTKTTVYI